MDVWLCMGNLLFINPTRAGRSASQWGSPLTGGGQVHQQGHRIFHGWLLRRICQEGVAGAKTMDKDGWDSRVPVSFEFCFSRLRCVQILLCRISLFRTIPIFVNIFQSSLGDVLRCSYGQDMNFLSNILDFAANDKDRPLFHVTSWNWGGCHPWKSMAFSEMIYGSIDIYTLWWTNIAIENGHL